MDGFNIFAKSSEKRGFNFLLFDFYLIGPKIK
jgi:hypothetical protein